MIILKFILCIIIFGMIPVLLGLLVTKFMKENNNLLLAFVIGYIFEFASFELLYLPMYYFKCSFKTLLYVWSALIVVACTISIILNRKRFKILCQETLKNIKRLPNLFFVWIILLCIQIYFPVRYMQHIDPDDAFYLATTNTTIETNSLFQYDGYTGEKYHGENMLRYSMAGLVIYYAALSEIINIHPAILIHTIWPAVAMVLEFSVYVLIGNKLLKGDKEKLSYFLIFLSVTYIFGWISVYMNFAFFAYRSWQGKSLIANFVIPVTWLFYMLCMENDKNKIYWLVFFMLMIASIFVTEMGVFLIPVEVGILGLIYLVQNRKIGTFIKSIVCCIPQIIAGVIYLFSL